MTLLRSALALAATIAFTAACSSSAAPATPAPAAGGGASVTNEMSGFAFTKATLDIAKGTTVTWTNKDSTAHTVSSGTPPTKDGKFDGQVAAGGTFSFTFNDVGTFKYFCAIHNSMTGTITVR
jgi:plastocyanin